MIGTIRQYPTRPSANGGGNPPNWPSTTGKPSGGGRDNNPPKGK